MTFSRPNRSSLIGFDLKSMNRYGSNVTSSRPISSTICASGWRGELLASGSDWGGRTQLLRRFASIEVIEVADDIAQRDRI